MSQEIFSVYAPCAHWVYEGKVRCNGAESLVSVVKELLKKKGCEPQTDLQIIIEWCPKCKAGFAKIIHTPGTVFQMQILWAVDAETVGYQAFAGLEELEYVPADRFDADGKREDGTWELQALKNEVYRLRPDSVWIKDDSCSRQLSHQLDFCQRALDPTKEKACNHSQAEEVALLTIFSFVGSGSEHHYQHY
ncbi:unnamed protein product [Fusarium venenatum]|uniref:Uncharacterized protein n=1 Tax=Fusarium venenatum TaxID=56646 RepID=A0A2L2TCQ6_9HYPO|nr:uncharacterized protein FVRRES_05202 [Fusarium venenatum]CEI60766.1 unnamed protein product [Fusarium venenatum]